MTNSLIQGRTAECEIAVLINGREGMADDADDSIIPLSHDDNSSRISVYILTVCVAVDCQV